MNNQRFLSSLAIITGSTSLVLALAHWLLQPVREHWGLSVALVVIFSLVCVGLYAAGKNAARSRNKTAFTGIVSASVFGKMVLSMGILLAYKQAAHPTNQWFVGIFFLVYTVYTVYEVVFMSNVAKGG
jgi:thiol:disulfide interchange protein